MIVYIYVFGLYFSFLKINSVLPRWRSIIPFPLLVELEEVMVEHCFIISGGALLHFSKTSNIAIGKETNLPDTSKLREKYAD